MANESEIIIDGSISPQNRDGESTFSGNITLPEGITDVKSQKEDNKNNAEFIETLTDSMVSYPEKLSKLEVFTIDNCRAV